MTQYRGGPGGPRGPGLAESQGARVTPVVGRPAPSAVLSHHGREQCSGQTLSRKILTPHFLFVLRYFLSTRAPVPLGEEAHRVLSLPPVPRLVLVVVIVSLLS